METISLEIDGDPPDYIREATRAVVSYRGVLPRRYHNYDDPEIDYFETLEWSVGSWDVTADFSTSGRVKLHALDRARPASDPNQFLTYEVYPYEAGWATKLAEFPLLPPADPNYVEVSRCKTTLGLGGMRDCQEG